MADSNEEVIPKPEFAPEYLKKLEAKGLFLYGGTPKSISQKLGIKIEKVRTWIKQERWDRAREEIERQINLRILRETKRDFAGIVNEEFSYLRNIRDRLYRELEGLDEEGNRSPEIQYLRLGDADKIVGHLLNLIKIEKDLTFQTMGSVSESLPKLLPEDLSVARLDNTTRKEEDDKAK